MALAQPDKVTPARDGTRRVTSEGGLEDTPVHRNDTLCKSNRPESPTPIFRGNIPWKSPKGSGRRVKCNDAPRRNDGCRRGSTWLTSGPTRGSDGDETMREPGDRARCAPESLGGAPQTRYPPRRDTHTRLDPQDVSLCRRGSPEQRHDDTLRHGTKNPLNRAKHRWAPADFVGTQRHTRRSNSPVAGGGTGLSLNRTDRREPGDYLPAPPDDHGSPLSPPRTRRDDA